MEKLFTIITGLICFVSRIFVTMIAWNWFMIPFGLPTMTFWWACGIQFLITCLTYKYDPNLSEAKWETYIAISVGYWIGLAISYIYYILM